MSKQHDRSREDIPYFVQEDIIMTHTLGADDSAHATRVLRLHSGDTVRVTDGQGHLYEGLIGSAGKEVVIDDLRPITVEPSLIPYLHIAIAPTKNIDRIEWLLEKMVEVGLQHFTIVYTEHTVRKNVNMSRLEKVMLSAMKQSRKVNITRLDEYDALDSFLNSLAESNAQKFIGYCGDEFEKLQLAQFLKPSLPSVFLIGPEGDFSISEVQKAATSGFVPVMLGRERLRTETAGLYAGLTHHVLNTNHL